MRRLLMAWVVGVLALGLSGCFTSPSPGGAPEKRSQRLSMEEKERLAAYNNHREGILIDDLIKEKGDKKFEKFQTERIAYEGTFFLRYLGLRKSLSEEESYLFIRAIFEEIPEELPMGDPIRNIVIPKWFVFGSSLKLQVTKAVIENKSGKHPVIVVLMNASSEALDKYGSHVAKIRFPQYDYPRLVKTDKGGRIEADGDYLLLIQGNLMVSSNLSSGLSLPSFDSVKETAERISLADAYLRDEIRGNDKDAFAVAKAIYEDPSASPLHRLYAGANLFLYYLYQQEEDQAVALMNELQASPLAEDPEVKKTEILSIIQDDMPFIIKVNRRLRG